MQSTGRISCGYSVVKVVERRGRGLFLSTNTLFVISGFHRDVDYICVLMRYYAASSVNTLTTFRDNVLVPSSRVKSTSSPLKMGPIRYLETSVQDYHSTLRNIAEERRCNHGICLEGLSKSTHNLNKFMFWRKFEPVAS
jgi:hypothetical protein